MAHVLMLCFPSTSHLKPMLTIAELLCHNGLGVTVLHSSDDYNYKLHQSPTNSNHNLHQRLRFMPIGPAFPQDVFPPVTKWETLVLAYKKKFAEIMVSPGQEDRDGGWSKPTFVIADYFLSSAIEVAEEHNIPLVAYCPTNASVIWTYIHLPKLIELGQIPYSDDNIDKYVTCIPGMETLLRHRDLPHSFKFEPEHPAVQFFKNLATKILRASALILDTFQELEPPIIDKLGSIYSKIYTIGPLEDLVRAFRIQEHTLQLPPSFFRFRQENRSCLTWLDLQQPQSVIYASMGSIARLSHDKLLEIWYGLVNSGKPFILVAADIIDQRNEIPTDLTLITKERGFIVEWAPQEEVLKHPSVGGFFTHSGWNSTIESISAGVPMICWSQFADQLVNSRCVSHLWRIGLDMKDTCDRSTVEKMIRDLMEDKRVEIMSAMTKYSKMARECVKEGGSSHVSLKMLVEDIKLNNLGY